MTASQKPKTPSMILKVKPNTPREDIESFCKRASRLSLAQIVEKVTVEEQLVTVGEARRRQYQISLQFFPPEEYKSEYDVVASEILSSFGTKFSLILKKEIMAEMKRLDTDMKAYMNELGKGKKASDDHADDDNEDDEGAETSAHTRRQEDEISEVGDGDAEDEKRRRQTTQQATYSDDEEEEGEIEAFDDEEIEAAHALPGDEPAGSSAPVNKTKIKSLESQVNRVSRIFQGNLHLCTNFEFSPEQCNILLEVGETWFNHRRQTC